MKTIIASVTHKRYKMPADSLYLPLMAGSALMPDYFAAGYQRDDEGDNISEKNPSYCELTGLYWMWKNCDADNIGICHYRRYFACPDSAIRRFTNTDSAIRRFTNTDSAIKQFTNPDSGTKQDAGYRGTHRGNHRTALRNIHRKTYRGINSVHRLTRFRIRLRDPRDILTSEEAERLMEEYPIVLPKPRQYVIETNYSHYAHSHHAHELDTARVIISEKYPDYLAAFDNRMAMTTGHRFNMMIMRRDLLDQYCSWLFDILAEMEKRIDISGYSKRDRRVYGYTAERLLDVWLDKNGHPYAELPYIFTEHENLQYKAAAMIIRKLTRTISAKR